MIIEVYKCLNCESIIERNYASWERPECEKCGEWLDVVDVTNEFFELGKQRKKWR